MHIYNSNKSNKNSAQTIANKNTRNEAFVQLRNSKNNLKNLREKLSTTYREKKIKINKKLFKHELTRNCLIVVAIASVVVVVVVVIAISAFGQHFHSYGQQMR